MTYFRQQRLPICPKTLQGFTLLELLVALAIFAVIGVMAYSGLNIILTARLQTEQHAAQLARLQMAFTWLGRDIEQHIGRPIRDLYGDKQPALQGTFSQMEFTRAGWRNPAQQPRSSLQRVAYHIEDKILWRSYWRVLDRAQDARPIQMKLINDIDDIKYRYLDESLRWHEEWPPDLSNTAPDEHANRLLTALKAIEVTLTVAGWGRITRLFRVPGA